MDYGVTIIVAGAGAFWAQSVNIACAGAIVYTWEDAPTVPEKVIVAVISLFDKTTLSTQITKNIKYAKRYSFCAMSN